MALNLRPPGENIFDVLGKKKEQRQTGPNLTNFGMAQDKFRLPTALPVSRSALQQQWRVPMALPIQKTAPPPQLPAPPLTQLFQGFARIPETVVKSVAQPLVDAIYGQGKISTSDTQPNTGFREAIYGKEPIKNWFDTGKDITGNKEGALLAPVLATLDLATGGKSTPLKGALKGAVKPTVKAALPTVTQKVAQSADEIIYGGSKLPQVVNKMRITEKLSPDRLIRTKVTQPIEQAVKRAIFKGSVSSNPLVRGAAKIAKGFGAESGIPEDVLTARRKMYGATEFGKLAGKDVAEKAGAGLSKDSLTRVWATLDPSQAAKIGVKAKTLKLTPAERAVRQKLADLRDYTTKGNLERGLINPSQAKNNDYLTRRYAPFEELGEYNKAYNEGKTNLLKSLKLRKDNVSDDLINKAITDPTYLVGKRLAESEQAWAMVDYANFLAKQGFVSNVAKPGFRQLPKSKLYGQAAGKFVPENFADDLTGFQYQWGVMNSMNDVLTAYDRWTPRQIKKDLLTRFNPAVRLGNQMTNRVVFSTLNGINPVEFNVVMQQTHKMIKNRSPEYLEAVRQGLMGTDITNAMFAKRISDSVGDRNIALKALDWVKKSYSDADDRGRLAAFVIHMRKGYGPDEAARMAQRGFQDYKSVGFFYDMAAKLPLIGNAFVRFAGDANRIVKNAIVDHPLRTIATVGMWATFTNMMSQLSGETEEDKQTREDRFGAPKIPFTDIPLTVQTPMGEVNLARFMPFYQLNEVNGQISRFLPIQADPTKPEGWQDPLLGQVAQIVADKDFRGRSIRDPENTTYYGEGDGAVKKYPGLPEDQQVGNVTRFLATQNLPLGREVDALVSAATGKPDVYGKERELPQAIARSLGLKVEQFGAEQAQKQRDTNKYFEGNVERVKQFVGDNPDLAQTYYQYNNPTRDRVTGKKVSSLVSPERWRIVNADQSGRLYDFLKQEALAANAEDGRPVDPVYKLPTPDQQKLILELRSRPTGDDIEAEEILRATQPWYGKFEEAEGKYYTDNSAYWGGKGLGGDTQNARVKEYGELYDKMYPKQTPLVQKYYQTKEQNPEAAREFYKTNADQLSSDFEVYRKQRLDYINAKRKIEGYPPISVDAFNNVTFGYEEDEQKVARELYYKLGGGFAFGKQKPRAGSVYRFAVSPAAGGKQATPKITTKKVVAKSVRGKASKIAAKPKVTLKKSLV